MFAGGFARVHVLEDRARNAVVWKTMRHADDCGHLQREHEVITAQLPRCANIISCVATVENSARAIEALVLRPVGHVVSDMPAEDVSIRDFIADMATALVTAHAAGVCRCDVRPANIVFAGGRYVLIDWGLCATAGTCRADIHGVVTFSHDDILTCVSETDPYKVSPAHDCASLGYTVLAILHGRKGRRPWPHSRHHEAELVDARKAWLASARGMLGPDVVGWVSGLLSGTATLEGLRGIKATGPEGRMAGITT
jgi:hypothetical protein